MVRLEENYVDHVVDDDESDSAEDCLKDMLGGISFDLDDGWKEDDEQEDSCGDTIKKITPGLVDPSTFKATLSSSTTTKRYQLQCVSAEDSADICMMDDDPYQNSFCCTSGTEVSSSSSSSSSTTRKPNHRVQIVDMGTNRGNGLVASRSISKGSVIFTEKAFVATQIIGQKGNILACQYCFRSLEPITKLSSTENNNGQLLPCPERWPILPLEFDDVGTSNDSSRKIMIDKYKRIQCRSCLSLFCCQSCYTKFEKEYGLSSCCLMETLSQKLEQIMMATIHTQQQQASSIISLSCRLFFHITTYYRTIDTSIENYPILKFCGCPDDIQALQLEGTITSRVYEALSQTLQLTSTESEILSLILFQDILSKVARNGFDIKTQSPFTSYYSSLLHHNYGSRDSPEHLTRMECIAKVITGKSKFERDIDRLIEDKVCPEIAATFLLTPKMNHSCQPNAQVRCQEFADAHIDIVAMTDIDVGEEICISYIGVGHGIGKKSTRQRRQELQAKYLFVCDCPLCCS